MIDRSPTAFMTGTLTALGGLVLGLLLFAAPAHTDTIQEAKQRDPLNPATAHMESPVAPPDHFIATQRPTATVASGPVAYGDFVSIQVNVDDIGNNILGDAANEPSLAIDPTNSNNIAIGWRQFDTIQSDFRQAGWAYSRDAGQTWTFPGVLEPGQFRSDPVLAADAEGNFYYYSLSTVTSVEVFTSADRGVTWDGPRPGFGGDKAWMIVDRTESAGRGNIYASWGPQSCCPGDFTVSADGGLSFIEPVPTPQRPTFGTMTVDHDGNLYIAGRSTEGLVVVRSSDAKFAPASPSFDQVVNFDLGGIPMGGTGPQGAGLLGVLWIASDHSTGTTRGNLYVLAAVDPPGADPLDIMFVRSTDGGLNWSTPVRVNDDPAGNGAWQWFGTMSVAPNGRIDAVWNDTRNTGAANLSQVYFAFSEDAGVTWSTNVPVTPVFDSHVGWPVQQKLGDYYHMISDSGGASLAYAATFNGEQDVYFVSIRVPPFEFLFPEALPAFVFTDTPTAVTIRLRGIGGTLQPSTAKLFTRIGSEGGFVESSIGHVEGDHYRATLPPVPCGATLQYYFEARSSTGQTIRSPVGAPTDVYETTATGLLLLEDNLETPSGWTAGTPSDTATTGTWEHGDPIGTDAQPEDDHTPTGNACWFTGQGTVDGELGENDVDDGGTTLMSPVIDLPEGDAIIGYWRWYSNGTGATPFTDILTADVSNDGGASWVNVETVGPAGDGTGGGWVHHSFRVGDFVQPTANIRLRFVASDLAEPSLIEAAIDDMTVVDLSCTLDALTMTPSGSRRLTLTPRYTPDPIAIHVNSPDYPCLTAYVSPSGTLSETPVYREAGAWGIVRLHGPKIVPDTIYVAELELADGTVVAQATAVTAIWGDTVGAFAEGVWPRPDGAVDIGDAVAALERFSVTPTAPPIEWCDIHPETPNEILDILDITSILDAFAGMPYPFAPPCP